MKLNQRQLFLDCDDVLAGFGVYGREIFGMTPRRALEELGKDRFWEIIKDHGSFFSSLPVLDGGRKLYEAVKHLNPIILTGADDDIREWAEPQKRIWSGMNFPGVKLICCASKNKRLYMKPGDVLIDDWPKYRHLWEEAGGIFVLHRNETPEESIEQVLNLFSA